ncbi:UDP-2,4-diacetamido-2,4,6-trideoxy-beta-L-altropyranose hydrolase [Bacillus sp. FJAT-52991]|uniref:UDP-2,4-diacetamido-2,4, 6-trideoxy-beta-L-altropyranose hydrolase n=1 Tax=Bacillus kandeliae TaxID=3129297 RepID=A0ABZ2N509_9BACI
MNILVRVDSSTQIGSGHVMRCLTLADILQKKGICVEFICRELQGNLISFISQKGYRVHILKKNNTIQQGNASYLKHALWLEVSMEQDAKETCEIISQSNKEFNLLIVDHYALDINWEKQIKKHVKKIMVIDDLADRNHLCDILLDQNFYKNQESRYDNKVPFNCKKFLGPNYVLLREEFYKLSPSSSRLKVERIILFFGGTDPTNETIKAINAFLSLVKSEVRVDVIVGTTNANKKEIEELCYAQDNIEYHCQVSNIAELMSRADLAVGAGGTAIYERCYVGLPTIVVTIANNQEAIVRDLHDEGHIYYLGKKEEVSESDLARAMLYFISNEQIRNKLSNSAKSLLSNNKKYVAKLIAEIIEQGCNQ